MPLSEAARALCDAEITRIVLDADSLPLDVGRTQRLYTAHLRRAVIARDRHCAWPGCTRHARWSEIHHLDWWDRDTGTTSVDRGLLLCTFHHQEVHTHDLAIRRLPTSSTLPRPGAPPGAPPPPPTYEFTYRTTGRPIPTATPATSGAPAAVTSRGPGAARSTGAPERAGAATDTVRATGTAGSAGTATNPPALW